jgi:hypothetical protein
LTYGTDRLPFVAPGTGVLRLARAAFFAVSAVGLASAAHVVSGDGVPAAIALCSVPVVMIVVNLLAATRRGPVGLFIGMGLTQIVLHVAFMVTPTAPVCGPSPAMPEMGMAGGHGHVAVVCESVTGHGAGAAGLWPSVPMALAHVLATGLLVLLLARGEAAVWALAAGLRFRFRLPGPAVLLPAVRRLPVATATARPRRARVHLRTVRRRGPPVLAGAVL